MSTDGQAKRILFLGDSITDCGRDRGDEWNLGEGFPKFFAHLWDSELQSREDEAEPALYLNRGISGDRTKDVLDRFQSDVEQLKPDVVFLLIGINNVLRAFDSNDPTTLENFNIEFEDICRRIKEFAQQPKLIIAEPFLLSSHPGHIKHRSDLDPKIHAIRGLAARYADLYIPLDGLLNARALNGPGAEALSEDGVHPTEEGHQTIADLLFQYLREEASEDLL